MFLAISLLVLAVAFPLTKRSDYGEEFGKLQKLHNEQREHMSNLLDAYQKKYGVLDESAYELAKKDRRKKNLIGEIDAAFEQSEESRYSLCVKLKRLNDIEESLYKSLPVASDERNASAQKNANIKHSRALYETRVKPYGPT